LAHPLRSRKSGGSEQRRRCHRSQKTLSHLIIPRFAQTDWSGSIPFG
jgi:hypothetical protein